MFVEDEILGDVAIELSDGEALDQEKILDDIVDLSLVLKLDAFDQKHIAFVFHDDMRFDGLVLVGREELEIADDVDDGIGDALLVYGEIGDVL